MTIFSIHQEDARFVIILFGLRIKFKNIFINRLAICNSIPDIKIHRKLGTLFPHPVGIVLPTKPDFGRNCIIFQNVTIGTGADFKVPKLGNNVIVYANAVVFGGIEIGDDAVIAAGSVVNKSVPPGAVIGGNPGKIIGWKKGYEPAEEEK